MSVKREDFIVQDTTELKDENSSAVAYLGTNKDGLPTAMAFYGRRQKPNWHYRFKTVTERDDYVATFFKRITDQEATARKHKEDQRAQADQIKIGDVMVSSWGYDQTNIDFYQITGFSGKTMVKLRQIASKRAAVQGEYYENKVVADVGAFIGDEFRKRLSGNYISLTSFSCASLWDGSAKSETAAGYGH